VSESAIKRGMDAPLVGKTMLISAATRGHRSRDRAAAARDGANVALIAKTTEPQPKLEGIVQTAAAEEIRPAGGNALPIVWSASHSWRP
jgi:citronellol/citronellal dehydrogenase